MAGPPNPELRHVAVLPGPVLEYLAPKPGETMVDCTVGGGGHSELLLQRLRPGGRLIGLDRDSALLARTETRLKKVAGDMAVELIPTNFGRLREVLDELGIAAVDGVLADLGVSSVQLDDPQRGLSFQRSGPLDMRMNPEEGEPASALVNRLSERELADLFWNLGEERFSRRIARRIVETRRGHPLQTTDELAEVVRRSVPQPHGRRQRIDPATRVFQALRIAVNDELGELDRLLAALPGSIKPGGRAAVISFHSLEDRRVKQAFRDRRHWQVLTRKPHRPDEEEVRANPRARSAKLRAAVRTADVEAGRLDRKEKRR